MRQKFICGNWKMYKNIKDAEQFASEFKKIAAENVHHVKIGIAAPYIQLAALAKSFAGTGIVISAENMHFEDEGAFTGEISAAMLREIGINYSIIGHSERRQYFGETDETVALKTAKALAEGMYPIVCVGESLNIRESGSHLEFVADQVKAAFKDINADDMSKITIAYEPVWAIGTGKTATADQAQEMCAHIRKTVGEMKGSAAADAVIIQYGGSVKPANAGELMNMPDIDGALVGGASLKPEDFIRIINY